VNYYALLLLLLSPLVVMVWGRFQPSVREDG
jgi:hypothetical protein